MAEISPDVVLANRICMAAEDQGLTTEQASILCDVVSAMLEREFTALRERVRALEAGDAAWKTGSEALQAECNWLTAERDNALGLLRGARATLKSHADEVSDHVHQEMAAHLDDEPLGRDGDRITTRIEQACAKALDEAAAECLSATAVWNDEACSFFSELILALKAKP